MVVCETGTGSGAMSHAIMRTIAPLGKLHTFEFNKVRADQARQEFAKNGLSHLVNVYHKDVCGKAPVTLNADENNTQDSLKNNAPEQRDNASEGPATHEGGFGLDEQSVSAIFLDLPEPWLAIPHAAFCLKPNGRIASYSPCMEQTQRTAAAMHKAGFHSLKTMEFRIRENYVDEAEYELPPKEKRPRLEPHATFLASTVGGTNNNAAASGAISGGEDTGAEADNEKSEISETEADQLSLATAGTAEDIADTSEGKIKQGGESTVAATSKTTPSGASASSPAAKRKKVLVARPFVNMRGHTAFLTFATAGNLPQPDPNKE